MKGATALLKPGWNLILLKNNKFLCLVENIVMPLRNSIRWILSIFGAVCFTVLAVILAYTNQSEESMGGFGRYILFGMIGALLGFFVVWILAGVIYWFNKKRMDLYTRFYRLK